MSQNKFAMQKDHLRWVAEMGRRMKSISNIISVRYTFVILGCLGFVNIYAMRVNLSVAMVVMVNSSFYSKSPNLTRNLGLSKDNKTDPQDENGEFVWDAETQGLILGSFYWGYIFTQIPGGRLAEMYSGKWFFGGGILITAVLTLLTPLAARCGVGYLIANRVFQGFGQGVTFPAMHVIISKWAPINERSRFVALILAGSLIGTVLGFHISSSLCEHGFAGGWPSVFYTFGVFGVFWFILWSVLVYNDPEYHPWIKNEEKQYILSGIIKVGEGKEKLKLPWKEMIKSLPLWSIVAAHVAYNWGLYTFLTELPTYLKSVLHFDLTLIGLLSALPYLISFLCSLLGSYLCDKLVQRNFMQLTTARKVFNSLGLLTPGVLLIGMTFVKYNSSVSYSLLALAIGINGCAYAGYQGNHIDIAPNFAGTLMGITNTLATLPGMISPLIAGALTEHNSSCDQWNKLFYITSAFYIFGGVFFFVFSSAEQQYWNNDRRKETI